MSFFRSILGDLLVTCLEYSLELLSPFSAAAPFWGQNLHRVWVICPQNGNAVIFWGHPRKAKVGATTPTADRVWRPLN